MLLVWQATINDIQSSKPIIIPRWYNNNYSNHVVDLSLHGFSDASNIAFGCCIYLLCSFDDEHKICSLITAKSRIAQIKNTSIPRLELKAALLLAETMSTVKRDLYPVLKFKQIVCWCDSTIIFLFTSATPRALFLDLVPDTSAESCIRSLRRFFAKRGTPSKILSDNGSQFTSNLTQNFTSSLGITWHFNIPAAPWWGGFFERLVGSTKRCLRKITHKDQLSYKELLRFLAEVESILNNRPITFMYESPGDLPLTPNHLIYGRSTNFKGINDKNYKLNLNTRSTYIEDTLNHFWQRWEKEYLTELREFHKCKQNRGTNKIAVGDVVLIHDSDTRRGNWKTGIVQSLSKSSDGLIRAAKVRYIMNGKTMYIQRPVNKLYLLEALDAPIETMKINFCDEKDIKHFVIH
ncbi:uncharacterized protein LOC124815033 [Hydra vulgaris]|uniref:uncharacterized protein LOC124815033 n=1 Tax=Hydra vulgaris TaxID=6087 RepID=UPI001F5E8896|nr:uncharacterized protein LOC124815033 [Hydra vulgaris]